MLELGGSYWINNGGLIINLNDLKSPNQLFEFIKKDDFSDYYIIGRNYDPNDLQLSEENISETVLTEFRKVFMIYDLIKFK